mgnify:CR=1 FL=1
MKLTNNQKKYLRSMAHDLKPFVMIGQHGLSESVISELGSTLLKHELIKIKLRVSDREEKQQIVDKILLLSNAELVQLIGGVLIIYKAFEDNPDIILPRK